ncbi:MAG: hypothetical protein Q9166_002581 [cf. Caloplaca sp. 2 TL-2023]
MRPSRALEFLRFGALLNSVLEASAYDYEPGDVLNRTMCFCTSDSSLEQTDMDPFAFFNTTPGHQIGFVYQYQYYNHRLDKRFLISTNETCDTVRSSEKNPPSPYYHNKCLDWENQKEDYCAKFELSPHDDTWEFCYLNRGDELDDPSKRDFFKFNGEKRAIPRKRDYIAPVAEVETKCEELCEETLGMELFRSKQGGWFNRMDGFHASLPLPPLLFNMYKLTFSAFRWGKKWPADVVIGVIAFR